MACTPRYEVADREDMLNHDQHTPNGPPFLKNRLFGAMPCADFGQRIAATPVGILGAIVVSGALAATLRNARASSSLQKATAPTPRPSAEKKRL